MNNTPWVYHYHAEHYEQNGSIQHRDGIICSSGKIDNHKVYVETYENIRKAFQDNPPLRITITSLSFLHGPTERAEL